ncbi:glycosyltransferase [Vibrio sp. F13]|uniref:glycosyltransferase n=1 Tax=Vibrio sp. F13 TaxID=2070777 RepID=UPI0010BDC4F4|nr:glycosyltransferase [Vibrio sp. F13]TKF74754.1 glycosyltransferase [Vibrio sp. F13]
MIKKMVFVISALRGGGAEKFVLNLYKAMEKYQGYECHIVSIEKAVEHNIAGYRVHFVSDFCNVSKKGIRRLWYKKNVANAVDGYIRKYISKDAFILSNMLLADKIMSESKLRVHHVIHNSYKTAFLSGKRFLKIIQIKNKINNLYRNHPLVFVSQAAFLEYKEEFISKFNNQIIYNPTELGELEKQALIPIDESLTDNYLIHIGRFNRQKRHDRLLNAFSQMKNQQVRLLLMGEGSLMEDAKAQTKLLGLEERVVFKGFKTNPYPYLKQSRGLVLSSDFEGLPTVLIEAMALDVPIVTTDCSGGIHEIIGDNLDVIAPCDEGNELAVLMDKMLLDYDGFKCDFPDKFSACQVSSQYHLLNLESRGLMINK